MKTLLEKISFLIFILRAYWANSQSLIYHNFLDPKFLRACREAPFGAYIWDLYVRCFETYFTGLFIRFYGSFSILGFISLLTSLNQAWETRLWIVGFLLGALWHILKTNRNSSVKILSWAGYLGFLKLLYRFFLGLPNHWYFLGVVLLYVTTRPLLDFLAELVVFSVLKIFYSLFGTQKS